MTQGASLKWLLLVAFALFFFSITVLPGYGAARFSGTIIAADPSSGMYTLQLADGTIKKIKMKSNASSHNSSGGSFSPGQHAVFSIVSPLNDDPLIADSIMDDISAKKTAPAAYTIPSNTRVGGYATSGGPSATGGTNPNVLASVAQGGGNFTPPNVINAPFTSTPSPVNSPYTGQVLTNPGGNNLNNQSSSSYVNMMNGQNSMTASPSALNNPFTGLSVTGNTPAGQPPSVNQGSIITGQKNFQATPANMIMDQSNTNDQDPLTGGSNFCDPSSLMANSNKDDEEDENILSMFGDADQDSGMPTPCQINARVLDINLANGVIFYCILGSQEMGTAVVTPQTRLFDGQTRQQLSLQTLPRGGIIVINGFQSGGNSVQASSITLMQRQ